MDNNAKKFEEFYIFCYVTIIVLTIVWNTFFTVRTVLGSHNSELLANILTIVNNKLSLFNSEIFCKMLAFTFLLIWGIQRKCKKKQNILLQKEIVYLLIGVMLYFGSSIVIQIPANSVSKHFFNVLYIIMIVVSTLVIISSVSSISKYIKDRMTKDVFNKENETFPQDNVLRENAYSVNIRTKYQYNKKMNNGYINVVNPFRATAVLGTPGSGKSFAIINAYIRQHLAKDFTMYCYDIKYPELTKIVYANYIKRKIRAKSKKDGYNYSFKIINVDEPTESARCNPINPKLMEYISDAYQAAYTIMLNLNKSWIQKQGDFFVESPIILLASIIWFLKIYKNGKYCTFPHAIELLNQKYDILFVVLMSYKELRNYLAPFMDAWQGGAQDQLQGQLASAKIPLARLSSPQIYWVMTGDDLTLDINNPNRPTILCVGSRQDRIDINSAILGLYNAQLVKLVNKPDKKPCSMIIDELPTIYFRGIDNLINTARSNKVAVCVGFQDFSQLKKDYGDKEAEVIRGTIGNIFSGTVVGESAKWLSSRFGKNLQKKESISVSDSSTSVSTSYQNDYMIPESAISALTQGFFVGNVVDDFDQRIENKVFHSEIQVDMDEVKKEKEVIDAYPLPKFYTFVDKEGNDCQADVLNSNFERIKDEVNQIIKDELARLQKDNEINV